MISNRRKLKQSGVVLIVGVMSLIFIVPLVGLAIDVAVLYTVKARLQASVDGAALAAARSLNLGSTTSSQAASGQQNAVNWFYANFPSGNWGTSNTHMTTSNVSVFDDPNNAHLRNVTVSADTTVPTYFMRWFNKTSVVVSAFGNASRRDVVVMMVLDKSGSMGDVCDSMVQAAKLFTGQFAANRDMIGLVSFNDSMTLHSSPTTNFQTTLGYTNSSGSANGIIDTINCGGGTGTAGAISLAYNELYRMALPGALNVIMFETDGLPNTLALNFWDSSAGVSGLSDTSTCTDVNGDRKSNHGFNRTSDLPNWTTAPTLGSGSYFTLPSGIVGSVYSADPAQGTYFDLLSKYWSTNGYISSSLTDNCGFNSNHQSTSDFAWWPMTDIWGNSLAPATNPYKTVTTSGGHVEKTGWTNFHNGALNATDNAAYRARTNATLPVYFFGIALGGNSSDSIDFALLQRMTNDPNGDGFNNPAAYQPCAVTSGCITYSNQPQGTFVYSSDANDLSRAFLAISSQILRLSK